MTRFTLSRAGKAAPDRLELHRRHTLPAQHRIDRTFRAATPAIPLTRRRLAPERHARIGLVLRPRLARRHSLLPRRIGLVLEHDARPVGIDLPRRRQDRLRPPGPHRRHLEQLRRRLARNHRQHFVEPLRQVAAPLSRARRIRLHQPVERPRCASSSRAS
ncbi:hypothetical protein [Novosphingobium sp. ST904]|uniref:hypothetical protein n=1 Tax=Novosphingobium sp. ST904 TaxID=1684385 RepID=UPI0006C88124|nr:hypothetical protein [Novosphingobium sp. ST904]KPH64818.1 hypothetical protein ADT71_11090 [Novosphingobium sp. ST904]